MTTKGRSRDTARRPIWGRRSSWVALAALSLACERPGDPPSDPAVSSAEGKHSGPARSLEGARDSTERVRCVMPPRPPQPVARPAADCPPDPEGPFDLGTAEVVFVDAPGQPRVVVEHAISEAERSRGLMYRTELPEDAGMLFSWDSEAPRSFWMKNTCLPLDMLFVDTEGYIVNVLEQVPTLNTLPRRSGCPASRVIEVNAGWTRAHGVSPGQRVEIR